eukprot:553867-Pyramimonas_sp.AAC.1
MKQCMQKVTACKCVTVCVRNELGLSFHRTLAPGMRGGPRREQHRVAALPTRVAARRKRCG